MANKTKLKVNPKGKKLVHAQTMIPEAVFSELQAFAEELDPHSPNLTAAFRRIAVEWYEQRKKAS